MSVPVQPTFSIAVGNGVTTTFAFPFLLKLAADLQVAVNGVALSSGFTVAGLGQGAGGSVTFASPPAAGVTVLLRRIITLARTTDYQYQGDLKAQTLNDDFDRLWMAAQEQSTALAGAIRAPITESLNFLPGVFDRAGRVLVFDPLGQPKASTFTATQIASTIAAAYSGAAGPLDALSYLAAGAGAVSRSAQAKLRDDSATPYDFGAFGNGLVDDTVAIQRALNTGRPVYLPPGDYLSGPLTMNGGRLYGTGRLVGSAATANAALITATDSEISGISIIGAPGVTILYGILFQGGTRATAREVVFAGSYGHCVIASGSTNVQILGVRVLQGGTHTAPIVISQCVSFTVAYCTIEEHTGFGIQVRFSGVGSVVGNTVRQRFFMDNFTATAATQTFNVTPARTVSKFSVYCAGAFHPVTSAPLVSGTDHTYAVTATGLTPGQPVAIYSFVGLECIQMNSGCYDVTAAGNNIDSSGDSGIVMGADYHNSAAPGQPADWGPGPRPDQVTEADWPVRCVATANAVRGPCLASGIAVNNGTDCMAFGNTISNVGYSYLEAYKVGVSLGLVSGGMYRDNTVDGTNGHTLAALKFVGGQNLRRPPTIGRNRGTGCKNFEGFPMRSTTERSFGYDIIDARVDDTVTRGIRAMLESAWASGNYSGNTISASASGAIGAAKDNTVVDGDFTAFRTVAGQYLDIGPTPGVMQLFRNKLVRIIFRGKVDNAGDSAYLQLYYKHPLDPDPNPPETELLINTTGFEERSVVMALGNIDQLFIRIGGSAGTGRICALRFDMLDVEA